MAKKVLLLCMLLIALAALPASAAPKFHIGVVTGTVSQ